MAKQNARIVELQKSVKIAREALTRIKCGSRNPETIADEALEKLWQLERQQPHAGVVGHATPGPVR